MIISAGGFGNYRISDTNFDFMIVMRSKRLSSLFDHCFNIDLALFKMSAELKSHISYTLVVKVTPPPVSSQVHESNLVYNLSITYYLNYFLHQSISL